MLHAVDKHVGAALGQRAKPVAHKQNACVVSHSAAEPTSPPSPLPLPHSASPRPRPRVTPTTCAPPSAASWATSMWARQRSWTTSAGPTCRWAQLADRGLLLARGCWYPVAGDHAVIGLLLGTGMRLLESLPCMTARAVHVSMSAAGKDDLNTHALPPLFILSAPGVTPLTATPPPSHNRTARPEASHSRSVPPSSPTRRWSAAQQRCAATVAST